MSDTRTDSTEELIGQAEQLAQTDPARAHTLLARSAADLASQDTNSRHARAAYLRARLLVNDGHPLQALEAIEESRSIWLGLGNKRAASRTDLGRMHVLDDLGRHRETVAVGLLMLDVLDELDPGGTDEEIRWMFAAAAENLAVAYGFLGDHEHALDRHRGVENDYRQLGSGVDIARSLANQAIELIELGRATDALDGLSEAVDLFLNAEDRLSAGQALAYRARAESVGGSLLEAQATLEQALELLDGLELSPEWTRLQLELSSTFTMVGLTNDADRIQTRLIASLVDGSLRRDLVAVHHSRALARLAAGRHGDAAADLAVAYEGYAALGDTTNQARTQLTWAEMGGPQAAQHAHRVLELVGAHDHPTESTRAHLLLAEIDPDPATTRSHLDQARHLAAGLDQPHLDWQVLHARAGLAVADGHLAEARCLLTAAQDVIDGFRSQFVDESYRLAFLEGRDRVHHDLVAVLLGEGDTCGARATVAERRARTLIDRRSGRVQARSALSGAPANGVYDRLLRAGPDEAADLQRQAHEMETTALHHQAAAPLAPSAVRCTHDATETVIVYQEVHGRFVAFVGPADTPVAVDLEVGPAEVATLLAQLEGQRRRRLDPRLMQRHEPRLLATTNNTLTHLYLALIAPLEDYLGSNDLVVVPQGLLDTVPFSALFDGLQYLADRFAITVSPGVDIHTQLAQRVRGLASSLVIGVADDDAPLMVDEARRTANLVPAPTLLTGDEATAERFRTEAPGHDLIHLACHGLFRPDNPWFSAARFSDRWMTAAEASRLDLDGQLVILSSCYSGRQQSIGSGDEMLGFPYALLAAGASAIIANIWEADDSSSTDLMAAFHGALLKGETAAQAVRQAQLAIRQSRPDPRHWANTVLIGAPNHQLELPCA